MIVSAAAALGAPTVSASPDPYKGNCPKTIIFIGAITVSTPGPVSYAFSYTPPGRNIVILPLGSTVHAKVAGTVTVTSSGVATYSGTGSVELVEIAPIKAKSQPLAITTVCSSSTTPNYPVSRSTSSSPAATSFEHPLNGATAPPGQMPPNIHLHKLTAAEFQRDLLELKSPPVAKMHLGFVNPAASTTDAATLGVLKAQVHEAQGTLSRLRTASRVRVRADADPLHRQRADENARQWGQQYTRASHANCPPGQWWPHRCDAAEIRFEE